MGVFTPLQCASSLVSPLQSPSIHPLYDRPCIIPLKTCASDCCSGKIRIVACHASLGIYGHDMSRQHANPPHFLVLTASTILARYNLEERTVHYRQLVVDSRVVNSITSFSYFARASSIRECTCDLSIFSTLTLVPKIQVIEQQPYKAL